MSRFMRSIQKGAIKQSIVVRIFNQISMVPQTGVDLGTAGLVIRYRREGDLAVSVVPLSCNALSATHSAGQFVHIMDGYYRLDLPDAAFAAGTADGVLVSVAATAMFCDGAYIPLSSFNSTVLQGASPPVY